MLPSSDPEPRQARIRPDGSRATLDRLRNAVRPTPPKQSSCLSLGMERATNRRILPDGSMGRPRGGGDCQSRGCQWPLTQGFRGAFRQARPGEVNRVLGTPWRRTREVSWPRSGAERSGILNRFALWPSRHRRREQAFVGRGERGRPSRGWLRTRRQAGYFDRQAGPRRWMPSSMVLMQGTFHYR